MAIIARNGTIACMVGASDRTTFENVLPILNCFSPSPVYVGTLGAGHAVKSVNNLLNVTQLLLASQALGYLQDFGVAPDAALSAINGSSGRSLMTQERMPVHIIEGGYNYGFKLGLMRKDVRTALSMFDGLDREKRSTDTAGSNKMYQKQNETRREWCIFRKSIPHLLDAAVDEFGYDADYTEAARVFVDLHTASQSRLTSRL